MSIDYTSYSNDKDIYTTEFADTVDESTEEMVAETETTTEDDVIIKVDNCEKVYVRENPSKDSDHVAIVSKGADLLIIGASILEEDELWHNVCTETGAEGYIMAKFTNDNE